MKNNSDIVDFSECRFIEDQMQYYTYYDFCDNCQAIRRLFDTLTDNGKVFYHYYVYANTHMKDYFKNAIWDYLNGYDDGKYQLMELKKQYRARM
jgi:hypothetical protein